MRRYRGPYWNIYRAITAGWFIRYPGKMLRIIAIILFLLWAAPITWKVLILFLVTLIIIARTCHKQY